MKVLKYILISVFSLMLIVYLSFLFVLPNIVNLDKYTPQVTKLIEDTTGFQVKIKGLKVKTSWNLAAGVLIKKSDFRYPTGEKFAQVNNLDVRFSLFSFMFKKIKFDKVSADKALMNVKVKSDGTLLLSDFIGKNAPKNIKVKNFNIPMKFSTDMPKIVVKKYRFSFIDMNYNNNYTVKGTDLKITDFVKGKKIKICANGVVVLNGKKQITYKLNVFSKVFPKFTASSNGMDAVNLMKTFSDLYKYHLCGDIVANLKVSEDNNVDGKLSLNNLSAEVASAKLKPSNVNFEFDGKLVQIDSEIFTKDDGRAVVTGVFNNSKHKYISLKVNSDRTDIGDVLLVSNTLLQMIGNKDLNGVSAQGKLNANFSLKSDFKSVQSSGFLRLKNARITNDLFKVVLSSVFADIDFSQNRINILKSSALLNGEPIKLKGSIDKNAYSNLELSADHVSLKGLLMILCQFHFLRENDIASGLVDLNATLKGRLDKSSPEVKAKINNVLMRNKIHNAKMRLQSAAVYFTTNAQKDTKGIAKFVNLKVMKHSFATVSIPATEISFDGKNVNIRKSALFINNSKINFFGDIKNYDTDKPNTNITVYGLMRAVDIKSMLPPSNRSGVSAVGKIPLIMKIKGNGATEINAQMIANRTNHIGVFDINTLRGKTSLVNANLLYSADELRIREVALYALSLNHGLSENFNANIASGTKVGEVFGKIVNMSGNPSFEGVSVVIPNRITTSIPGYEGSSVNLKGELELNGILFNPQITGYLTVSKANIPTLKTSLRNLVLHFNKNSTSANCRQILLANSFVGVNAEILNDFSKGLTIKNLDFIANSIDMDALAPVLRQGTYSKTPIRILSGKGTIHKFKMGKVKASDITTDVTLLNNSLKLANIRGNSFFGKIAGNIITNILTQKTWINMQGRGLSAGPAINSIMNQSEDIAGKLDFDSRLAVSGFSVPEILRSLKGNTIFIISNGKMGSLGKLEHLLYAQNLLNSNIFNTSLNVIVKAFAVKNTGYYKYIKGRINFGNGYANIGVIKAAGATMSIYVTGRYYMPENTASLVILGRLSDSVVRVLGPFGNLSVSKVLSFIPNVGVMTTNFINDMTTPPAAENTEMIPPLIPSTEFRTREFKVMIDGDIHSQSSVKYFKWLSIPKLSSNTRVITGEQVKQTVQNIKQRVQEGAQDVWQQVAPLKPGYQSSGSGYYTPPKRRQPADFINNLPNLRN
jgi:hypothetical protein